MRNLDRYEDYPSYYSKQEMTVTMTDLDGKTRRRSRRCLPDDKGHEIRCRTAATWTHWQKATGLWFNPYQLELAVKEAMA